MKQTLISKIDNKDAIISIVGLGYVGLPLLLRFADCGFRCIGFDISQERVDLLAKGKSFIKHIKDEVVKKHAGVMFETTSDFSRISETDAIIICVPTPLTRQREPDLSYIENTLNNIVPFLRAGQIVSLESTTYPGTTEEILKPKLESTGLVVGKDIFLAYSPEREDPGNPDFMTETIPKVISGQTKNCLEVTTSLYSKVIDEVVPVSNPRTAEMTKLLENIHRSVNIGLVNEMKLVASSMDIDIHEVVNAAATKPFGFVPYYPGPGIGGHCIPIDPFYLTWKAREYNLHTRFIELAGEINNKMPKWTVDRLIDALNERGKPLKETKILILGLSYKQDVDDIRESPSLTVLNLLEQKGALVSYADPYVAQYPKRGNDNIKTSIDLTPDNIRGFDAVLLLTAHKIFNYDVIVENARLLIDTRGKYQMHKYDNVVKA